MGIPERLRFESELADLEIIGTSPRTRVPTAATLAIPHRWICRLTVPSADPTDRGYGMGTGVLIGPRHVLTAAHVLVSEEDPRKTVGNRLRAQPARNGDTSPFGHARVRGWQVHPRWGFRVGGRWVLRAQHDLGLVTLDTDIADWVDAGLGPCSLGYWGVAGACGDRASVGMSAAEVRGQDVQVTGYPGERPEGTLWTGRGTIRMDQRRGVLLHTADTTLGQSGSPVWSMRDGRCHLIGIHSGRQGVTAVAASGAMRVTHNAAVLLSPDVIRLVRQWMLTFRRP